jgi:hypothetical protein
MDLACLDDTAVLRCDRVRRGSCWPCVFRGANSKGLSYGIVDDRESCGMTVSSVCCLRFVMKFEADSLLGVVQLRTVSSPIFVREWIGVLGFFMASPMSSMMLMVWMFGWSAANGDVRMTGSCLVALLQLRPMTVPWLSEWMHLLCFMMSRSCISAGISIVGWQGIMVLFGGRKSRFLVHVCMCMLHISLTSSTYYLSVYIARAEDSTWYLLLGCRIFGVV